MTDHSGGIDTPFLSIPPAEWLASNRSAFAIADRYPVTPGHALVVARRLIPTWWDATPEERADILALVDEVRGKLDDERSPDGYNVGFNAGEAAGQTVGHLHVHVIPRYAGDMPDPRGGIRHVIPELGNYLAPAGGSPPQLGTSEATLFEAQDRNLRDEVVVRLRDPSFDRIDLLVSFVMFSGVELVIDALEDAVDRGVRVRFLTTDYLQITDPDALARLLDLADAANGNLEIRLFQDPQTSFHPKAYLFWSEQDGRSGALVGSSNLSKSGLLDGIEWSVGTAATSSMRDGFQRLWNDPRSAPLTHSWLAEYRLARPPGSTVRPEVPIEPPVQPVAPRPIQSEALEALERTRAEGYAAGLVVMATGLGKTWLAAFDSARPQFGRVLFVAHREEILRQSRDVFRQVMPDADLGLYFGGEKEPSARVVFASVQTLFRHLDHFAPDDFDYLVVDEFHHAAATSYRRVLDHFGAKFLLGITATPDRMDGADLLALCGDNLVYECDLVEGIRRDELVPFGYWGVPDTVDFDPIPWRNGRFDPEALAVAVETQDRAQRALEEWREHGDGRTLGFCASTSHADFMAAFFNAAGVPSAAVHSAPTSAPRHDAIDQLRSGGIQVLFAVDIFNEGFDLPEIDTVLMLRPTDSPVIFVQQLGRGLRIAEGKERLSVVDFVGNHRSFLLKPRTLLSLGGRQTPSNAAVVAAMEQGDFGLPPGCSVHFDLEAVEMLRKLAKVSGRSALEEYCRNYAEDEGIRPSAVQAFRAGFNPAAARAKHGSWFGLLESLDLLSEREREVQNACGDVLAGFETESITKSYKLVTLKALLHEGVLRSGLDVPEVARVSREIVQSDPRLVRDVEGTEIPSVQDAPAARWEEYWREWPIAAWVGELRKIPSKWFRLEGSMFTPVFSIPASLGDTFDAMAAEIVDFRLARYLVGKEPESGGAQVCRVGHADGRPLIWLNREQNARLPEGNATFVADGREYDGRFVKVALNVAAIPGQPGNALHALLRSWFGPSAGLPGTNHQVAFEEVDGALVLRPLSVSTEAEASVVPLFPSYEVACGAFEAEEREVHAAGQIELPGGSVPPGTFVCFARGDSMDGGSDPVRNGDPLLFEWVQGGSARDLDGERVLVEYWSAGGKAAALKRLARSGGDYSLVSDADGVPPIDGARDMTITARLLRRLDQSDVNPLSRYIGEQFKRADVPELYGLKFNNGLWNTGHVSIPGHAILFVTLEKDANMRDGSDYVDHFEGRSTFVWSSQNSTGPDGKKGREVLGALEIGTRLELWVRRRRTDVAFSYLGLVVPVEHHGSKPMSVRFRLLSPVPDEVWGRLQPRE